MTIVALGVLLLNDLLLKALWPGSWFTGKLSDLAWLVFALPLLAWGVPLWVWGRAVANASVLRWLWGLLVVGITALGSVACVSDPHEVGVVRLGIADDGSIVALTHEGDYSRRGYGGAGYYGSVDGGLTWNSLGDFTISSKSHSELAEWHDWRDVSEDTPRGTYTLNGPDVILVDLDGRRQVAYSTAYLLEDGNAWILRMATTRHGDGRILVSEPKGLIYDETSGNLVLAMEIQGVVVGTPGGEWAEVAAGRFQPADFRFTTKTLMLLTHAGFWITALTLAFSMTAAGLFASYTRIVRLLWLVPSSLALCMAIAAITLVVGSVSAVVLFWAVLLAPVVAVAALVATGRIDGRAWVRDFLTITSVVVSVLFSVALLSNFGPTLDIARQTLDGVPTVVLTWFVIMAWALGLACLSPLMDELTDLRPVYWSVAGMTGLIVLTFMLWLHLGIGHALARLAALALCAVAAIVLAAYVKRDQSRRKARWEACARSGSE